MRLVILESPYAGDVAANETYARRCLKDCIKRGESPIASHLLFTQPGVLDDLKHNERIDGMHAGWAWYRVAQACVVYMDRGVSSGMQTGIDTAEFHKVSIEYRYLEPR